MQLVECSEHNIKFKIPNSDEEYLNGKLHEEVEKLCEHKELHKTCKFIEVQA
jgi:predicted house-cleaning noncanonical NTP pyrophosphatase (MazG superfamily)